MINFDYDSYEYFKNSSIFINFYCGGNYKPKFHAALPRQLIQVLLSGKRKQCVDWDKYCNRLKTISEMPRPAKKRKAAIEREKRKKLKHYELSEDVSDSGYIREASSSVVSTGVSLPDIKEEWNSTALDACDGASSKGNDFKIVIIGISQISLNNISGSSEDLERFFQKHMLDPPSSPFNEWDIQVMNMAIPEIELNCPTIEDSYISEFDYLEMETIQEFDGMYSATCFSCL